MSLTIAPRSKSCFHPQSDRAKLSSSTIGQELARERGLVCVRGVCACVSFVCMCVDVCVCACVCVHVCVHACVGVCMYTCVRISLNTCTCVYTRASS